MKRSVRGNGNFTNTKPAEDENDEEARNKESPTTRELSCFWRGCGAVRTERECHIHPQLTCDDRHPAHHEHVRQDGHHVLLHHAHLVERENNEETRTRTRGIRPYSRAAYQPRRFFAWLVSDHGERILLCGGVLCGLLGLGRSLGRLDRIGEGGRDVVLLSQLVRLLRQVGGVRAKSLRAAHQLSLGDRVEWHLLLVLQQRAQVLTEKAWTEGRGREGDKRQARKKTMRSEQGTLRVSPARRPMPVRSCCRQPGVG